MSKPRPFKHFTDADRTVPVLDGGTAIAKKGTVVMWYGPSWPCPMKILAMRRNHARRKKEERVEFGIGDPTSKKRLIVGWVNVSQLTNRAR